MKEELKFQRAFIKKIESNEGTERLLSSKTGRDKLKRTLDLIGGTNPEVLTRDLKIDSIPDDPWKALNKVRNKDIETVRDTEIFRFKGKSKLVGHHGSPASMYRAVRHLPIDDQEYVFKFLRDLGVKHGMDPAGILSLQTQVHGKVAHGGDWTGRRTGAFVDAIPGESGKDFIRRLAGAYNIQMNQNEKAILDPLSQDWQAAMKGASEGLDAPKLDLNASETPFETRKKATQLLTPTAEQTRVIVESNPGNPKQIQQQVEQLVRETDFGKNQGLKIDLQNAPPSTPDLKPGARWGRRSLQMLPLAPLAASLISSGNSFANGNPVEGTAEAIGGIVGEVPVIGDAIVNTFEGSPVADGTLTGFNRDLLHRPLHNRKFGPNYPRPGQRERAQQLRMNPSSERGYETIGRLLTDGVNQIRNLFN